MRAAVLVRKLLGLSVATKSRCGFLIALVLTITIGVNEAVRHVEILSRNAAIVCIAVGCIGFASWIVGSLRQAKSPQPTAGQAAPGSPTAIDDPLGFLRCPRYWGIILILSASILSVLAICRRPAPVLEVRARPRPVVAVAVATNVVTVTNEVLPVVFPHLMLQGVVVHGTKSSAVINGRVLHLGETLSNVVLVAVGPDHATVTLEGETKVLPLTR
jgi:hypothetical protein